MMPMELFFFFKEEKYSAADLFPPNYSLKKCTWNFNVFISCSQLKQNKQ